MKFKKRLFSLLFALLVIPNSLLIVYTVTHSFDWEIGAALALSVILSIVSVILFQKVFAEKEMAAIESNDFEIESQPMMEQDHAMNEFVSALTAFSKSMGGMTGISEDILKGANIQSENVDKSTSAIIDISSGIEQIAVNATNVSHLSKTTSEEALEGFKVIETVIGKMNSIHQKVDHLYETIMDLSNYSSEISQIVNTISEIASNTNLLALNAAIEAARAGEHGKGFAVVSNEVRKLSEEAANSTKKIIDIVSTIQEKVSKSVELTNEGKVEVENGIHAVSNAKHSFEVIQREINHVSEQIIDVSAAVQELSAGSQEISNITEFTKKVQIGGVNKISELTEKVKQLMDEITVIIGKADELVDRKESHSVDGN